MNGMPTRPQQPGPERARPMSPPMHHFMAPSPASKVLVILLIVLSILLISAMAVRVFFAAETKRAVKDKQYQAVFLQNGQVYFGHMDNPDARYVKVTDIYYLQVQQQVQPQQSQQQPQVSLAKLGNELHGPEDVMYIARDQIIFWENLKDDSKVVQAIKDFQSKR